MMPIDIHCCSTWYAQLTWVLARHSENISSSLEVANYKLKRPAYAYKVVQTCLYTFAQKILPIDTPQDLLN